MGHIMPCCWLDMGHALARGAQGVKRGHMAKRGQKGSKGPKGVRLPPESTRIWALSLAIWPKGVKTTPFGGSKGVKRGQKGVKRGQKGPFTLTRRLCMGHALAIGAQMAQNDPFWVILALLGHLSTPGQEGPVSWVLVRVYGPF